MPLKHDPIEDTEQYKAIIDDVERELEEMLKDCPKGMGFCHHYWQLKRQLLEEKYGIIWRSPSMMNPHVRFD